MPPSSDSISSTSLPFGADTHIHATWRRSGSVPRSAHHEIQPAVYGQGPQACRILIADAQASDDASRLPNVQIPPSSIETISRSHKRVLRQHYILFWVLIGIFNISLIALTVAIVLGAVKAHQHGQNGAKCAAIIVGVFGFSGMVGSAALIWLILTGRKERARVEKRWADEEKVKEARSDRERRTESQIREIIRDRERSLSRSRSRGRGRDRVTRPAAAKIPSFRAMTPTSTSSARMPDHNTQPVRRRGRSPWPRTIDVSNDVDDDPDDAIDEENDKEDNNEKVSNHNKTVGKDKEEDITRHDEEGKAQAAQTTRDSASTHFQDLDPVERENEDNSRAETASRPDITILEQEILSMVSPPSNESNPFPAHPDPAHTSPIPLNTSSTYMNSSPPDPLPPASEPYTLPQHPPIEPTPSDPDILPSNHHVGIENPQGDHNNTPADRFVRWKHGGFGPAQSDDNFQAMLDLADDMGSEDERDRQLRRQKSNERVEKWACTLDLEAEGGVEREARGKRLREAVERGIQRMATRKRERRGGVVGD